LEENPFVDIKNFKQISDVRRLSIASICPYWCPIVPAYREIEILKNSQKIKYLALGNAKYTLYKRQPGCSYCEQFESYADADVLIFNSKKYLLETFLGRKPATDVEIIDECDEFLDSFSNEKNVNLEILKTSIENLNENTKRVFEKLLNIIEEILEAEETDNLAQTEEVFKLSGTKIYDLFSEILNINVEEMVDEENYIFRFWEIVKIFENFLDEVYFSFFKHKGRIWIKVTCLNLGKIFQELLDRNKAFVLMSGTVHSEKVLKDVFGLENFKIIEAETKLLGKVYKQMTGKELDCNYKKMKSNDANREKYLRALSNCIDIAERPIVVNVTSFWDLPNEKEIEKFGICNLMTREKLFILQENDKTGKLVKQFKNKEISVLFTTKCNRGIDFPGDICKSIIMTKYPYPDINSIFWKVLKKEKPEIYNEFYTDKARREFLQRVYRAVRFREDKVTLLSPDIRVFWNSKLFN
ncbi:MAG: helicase C-terminal domain-containing protein, partial [Candidatus Pacearchaeota archaeon]